MEFIKMSIKVQRMVFGNFNEIANSLTKEDIENLLKRLKSR